MRTSKLARATGTLFLLAALGAAAHADGGMTRTQVKAELAEAIRTGDIIANDESGLKANEEHPQLYPAHVVAAGKTRAQVQAELAEAIRTGDILASDESGLRLNEEHPQRYAKVRATMAAEAPSASGAAMQ